MKLILEKLAFIGFFVLLLFAVWHAIDLPVDPGSTRTIWMLENGFLVFLAAVIGGVIVTIATE